MSTVPHAGNAAIFKARTNKWFAGFSWFVAAAGLAGLVVAGGVPALTGAAPLLLIAYLGWLLFWRPAVVVHDTGVTIENPFRAITVPWAALVQVDTRYALTLVTPGRSYGAWAAPAPGIWGGRTPARRTSEDCRTARTGRGTPSAPATSRAPTRGRPRSWSADAGSSWSNRDSLMPEQPRPLRSA